MKIFLRRANTKVGDVSMKKRAKIALCLLTLTVFVLSFAACTRQKSETFTISVNGGTGGGVYESGAECTVTATVEEGFEFVGWKVGGEIVSEKNPYTFIVTKDLTIEAETRKSTETFTVTVVGGTGGGTFEKGEQCTVTATLKEDTEFVGWNVNGKQISAENPYTFEVTGNVKIEAVTKQVFTVTVIGGSGSGKFAKGDECVVTATLEDNEIFVGWTVKGIEQSKDNPYSFIVTESVEIAAVTRQRVSVGDFARKWISKETVLDLEAEMMTGKKDFQVIAVNGSESDTVISCKIDGIDYSLRLNTEGALELRTLSAGTDSEPEAVFMASADRFQGVWKPEEDEVYTMFVATPDADGYFGWAIVESDGFIDPDFVNRAVTRFVFSAENEASVEFYIPATGVTYILNSDGNICLAEENLIYTPTDALFGSSYVAESGKNIIIDKTSGKLTVDGKQTDYKADKTKFGAGIVYLSDGEEFTLIYSLDGIYEFSENRKEKLIPFDASQFVGKWIGENEISFDSPSEITFNGERYAFNALIVENRVIFGFVADGVQYYIEKLSDNDVAFALNVAGSETTSYYLSETAAQAFVGNYNANSENMLIVNEEFTVVIDEHSYNGSFAVLPKLDRTVSVPLGLKGIQLAALSLGDNLYLVWIKTGGLALLEEKDGNYSVKSAFYTAEATLSIQDDLSVALVSDGDFYTTGGLNAETLSFDFSNKSVYFNGEEHAFIWSYTINFATGAEYPVISFVTVSDNTEKTHIVYRYFEEEYIRMEIFFAGKREGLKSLVSDEEFSALCGTAYVREGKFVNESIAFGADGLLSIKTADFTENAALSNTLTYENYALTVVKGTLVVTYSYVVDGMTFDTLIYCDEIGKTISSNGITYHNLPEGLSSAAGQYYNESGEIVFELLSNGQYYYNDGDAFTGWETEDDFDTLVFQEGVLIGTKAVDEWWSGNSYTLTFRMSENKVSINNDEVLVLSASKKVLTPDAFIGTYTFKDESDNEIVFVISAETDNINAETSLVVSVDNTEAGSVTLAFDETGKQVLTADVGISIWATTYTIVLDGSVLKFSDGETEYGSAAAAESWDFSKFVLKEPQTLTDEGIEYTLTCVAKADGKMPLYFLKDSDGATVRLQKYSVTRVGENWILDISPVLGLTVRISVGTDGNAVATFAPIEE